MRDISIQFFLKILDLSGNFFLLGFFFLLDPFQLGLQVLFSFPGNKDAYSHS